MRVVLVTSESTYVKDNYYSLLEKLTDKKLLPAGVEIAGLVIIKTVSFSLVKTAFSLMLIGVTGISSTLFKNMFSSVFSDPRAALAKTRDIPVLKLANINLPESILKIKELKPDLIVNIRTRNIYKKDVLALPSVGCINVHHGLLPDNRGTMCDLWAWYEGRPVGFTVHWMNEKIDDGDIILTHEIDVSKIASYIDIPYLSSQFESGRLIECFAKIAREGRTAGIKNITENKRFTKNPTYEQIKEIKKKGLNL